MKGLSFEVSDELDYCSYTCSLMRLTDPLKAHQGIFSTMESLPRLIFGRELGLRRDAGRFTDEKKHMISLKCQETDIARVAENEENLFDQIPIYDIKFCPGHFHPNFVAVTDELGFVTIVDVQPGLEGEDKIILKEQCHENALFNMDWSPHTDGVLATCSGDQTVKVWDIKKEFSCVANLTGHGRSVKSVRFHPTNPHYLLSGGRDGGIRLWDLRVGGSSVNVIPFSHGKNKEQPVSVTDVLFQDENLVLSCGSKDGAIRLWDLRRTYSGYKKIVPVSKYEWKDSTHAIQGFHSMCIDSHNNLYASAFHEVLKFNLSSEQGQTDPAHFIAPDAFNSYVKVNTSHDGRFLISGSSLPETYIWDTCSASTEPFLVLRSSTEGLKVSACVAAFSPQDNLTIVAGNDEGQINVWRPLFENPEPEDGQRGRKYVMAARTPEPDERARISVHSDRCQLFSNEPNIREAQNSKLRMAGCRLLSKTVTPPTLPIEKEPSKGFDLRSLLKNLPNFVMDGTHPCLRDSTAKVIERKPCWLEDMKLSVNTSSTSMANFNTIPPTKRPASAMLLASRDLNAQAAPQPKKLKLKLKAQAIKTPKRTPKSHRASPRVSAARTPSTPGGRRLRRTSEDSSSTTKSPMSSQNIMKYFTTVQRTPAVPENS